MNHTEFEPMTFGTRWLGGSVLALLVLTLFGVSPEWIRAAGFFLAGVGAAPLGLWLAHRRTVFMSTQVDNEISRKVTDAFTKAVELLGHESVAVRMGGIHALGRLAHENENDHPKIMDIVAAFIQHQSRVDVREIINKYHEQKQIPMSDMKWEDGTEIMHKNHLTGRLPPIDLQAACNVIRDRNTAADKKEGYALDMTYLSIRNINFSGVALRRINFTSSMLCACRFHNADLSGANFRNADLRGCWGLTEGQLNSTDGNEATKIPEGIKRPSHWAKGAEK